MKTNSAGEFIRWESGFRHWVTMDGGAGPSGDGGFKAEPDRYHLYVSYACPWAHRTLIYRTLKGLQNVISVSVVHPIMPAESWVFGEYPGATPEHIYGFDKLHQLYHRSEPDFQGVVTVPVLYDKHREQIVNNESSEIIRMLNNAFDQWARADVDFYPENLRNDIDVINQLVYETVNNGVYRSGFAITQTAYEQAYKALFDTLDRLENHLSEHRYLVGGQVTEADWRLFPTLLRFDAVYYSHFKCNRQLLMSYPNLWGYTRELYQIDGVAETVNMDHIKTHYFGSHQSINPTGIVPLGPEIDFTVPHGRERINDVYHC